MKKHIRFILKACLAICMVLCMGLAVACQNNTDSDDKNTFTITILNEDGSAAVGQRLQYCSDGEGAQCYPKQTDSKGKVKIDISTDEWKNSETIHIIVYLADGYKVYDKNGNVLDYDDIDESYNIYIDHHKVNNVTFTIKADGGVTPNPDAEDIEVGYQYDVRGLSADTPKYYATIIQNSAEAFFEADVHGGEFELSVTSGTSSKVVETLNADNTSVYLSVNSSDFGAYLGFTITPKNANSNRITFTVCPVYELGSDGIVINASTQPDVYKFYLALDGTAELVFENPWDGPITEDQIKGGPITLKIGSSIVETWDSVADIAPISVSDRGYVPVTFEFDDPDNANLFIRVKNANATSDNDSIVLGQEINVSVENMFDESAVYTFIPEESGTYLVTFTGSETFTVQFSIPTTGWMSDTYFFDDSVDGVIKIKLESHTEYEVRFGTDNYDGPDSYSVIITKSTDPNDDDDSGNGNGGESGETIPLGQEYSLNLGMMESKTLTFSSYGEGHYTITVTIDDIETLSISYHSTPLTYTESDGKYVFEIDVTEGLFETVSLTFFSGFGTSCTLVIDN